MPLSVYDIFPDGTVGVPVDQALTGAGSYRWWHFDLGDPALADWVNQVLPEIPARTLLQRETRPRADIFGAGLILNLRGINLNPGQASDQMVSVRMWVSVDAIITVRVRRVFVLDEIRQQIEDGAPPATPTDFLENLITRLTNRIEEQVLDLATLTETYEDLDDTVPADLPDSRRRVIRLRRYLDPQRLALGKLAAIEGPLMPPADALRVRELLNRTTLTVEELDALHQRMAAVQDSHDTQTARQEAKHAKILSLVAAIFLPVSFLTGLFGVNIAGVPGLETPWAFAALCAGMTGLSMAMLVVLKWLRWF